MCRETESSSHNLPTYNQQVFTESFFFQLKAKMEDKETTTKYRARNSEYCLQDISSSKVLSVHMHVGKMY